LLVKPADDFLQPGFHIPGNVAGLAQILDDRGGEKPDRRRIGARLLHRHGGSADEQERKAGVLEQTTRRMRLDGCLRACGGVSHGASLGFGFQYTLRFGQ
jgi:hypothetical protein